MAKYVTGDPMALANMRFTGRLIFCMWVVAFIVNLVLALTGRPYCWIPVGVFALCIVATYLLMRHLYFGLTWDRHVRR